MNEILRVHLGTSVQKKTGEEFAENLELLALAKASNFYNLAAARQHEEVQYSLLSSRKTTFVIRQTKVCSA
jgi:hypothetical protein